MQSKSRVLGVIEWCLRRTRLRGIRNKKKPHMYHAKTTHSCDTEANGHKLRTKLPNETGRSVVCTNLFHSP